MGIIKNIRSIFPLPKAWENDSDRKAFGVRIDQAVRELFARISKCLTTAPMILSSAEKAQVRQNIGCGDASTYGVKNNLTTTASGYVLDARQGKALNDAKANDSEVVHKTGDETIKGAKTFNDEEIILQTTGRYASYRFKNKAGNQAALMQLDIGNATNQTNNRLGFYCYAPKSTPDTGNTGFYEGFRLPAPTAGITESTNYNILTSKNAVTVAQGGTGATSAADARTNLGLGAAATQAVKNNLTTTASGSVLDARQGKALADKIADIGSLFAVTTNTKNVGSSSPYSWTLTVNKSGYTPLMHVVYHNFASSATAGEEDASYSSGSASFSGFASRSGVTMTVKVLWVKNA